LLSRLVDWLTEIQWLTVGWLVGSESNKSNNNIDEILITDNLAFEALVERLNVLVRRLLRLRGYGQIKRSLWLARWGDVRPASALFHVLLRAIVRLNIHKLNLSSLSLLLQV
jgi:hypothetical protein